MVDHTVWCELDVADDVPALAAAGKVDKIELLVGLEELHPEDRVFISLNGHSLTKDWEDDVGAHLQAIQWDLSAPDAAGSRPHNNIDAHVEFAGVRFNPPPQWLRQGMNCVQVLLFPGNHRPGDEDHELRPILVTRVELFTGFKASG